MLHNDMNNPLVKSLADELAEVTKMGAGTGVGDIPPKEVVEDQPIESETPEVEEELEDDTVEESETPEVEEEDTIEDNNESEEDEDDEEDIPDDSSKAPKQIPVKKFHDEQRKRRDLESKIETMQAEMLELKNNSGSGKDDKLAKLKEFSDKYGFDPADIETLKGAIAPDLTGLETAFKTAKDTEEKEHFNIEYNSFVPSIKEKFPDATPEQLQKVKVKMDELAHSKTHSKHELDYIYFKNEKDFSSIFSKGKTQKGLETPQLGKGKPSTDTVKNFSGTNATPANFARLEAMPEKEQRTVLDNMDPLSKNEYFQYKASKATGYEPIKRLS